MPAFKPINTWKVAHLKPDSTSGEWVYIVHVEQPVETFALSGCSPHSSSL